MKELLIEEKAKAYDDAIKRAKRMFSEKELNYLFPELAESDDEKIISAIRKAIEAKVENLGNGVTRTACLAWLEKQGELVEINPSEFDSQLNKLLKQFETLPKEELASSLSFYLNVVKNGYLSENVEPTDYNSIDPHFGKPIDKVEPKFKVSDWCIDNEDGTIFQIVKVLDNTYNYRTNEGKEYSCSHYSLELDARLWTIFDAKDGNVLHSTGFHNDCIFIFNGLDNWKFDEPNGDRAVATGYCCLSVSADNMEFSMQGPDCVEVNTVKPATKEQCDVLFAKMKESGYEWDADKKELKKIEQKSPIVNFKARDWHLGKVYGKIYNAKFIEEQLTNQKRRLEIEKAAMSATGIIEQEEWFIKGAEWSDKNSSYISSEKQGEQKSFDYENANIPQKDSTWGEEDKHWMQKVIDFMNHPDLIKATPTLAKDTINWLKSLKDRVQPQSKQEWSEEDESNFQGIIDVIKENKHHATDYEHMTYYKLLSWFKSLKNRYVWKPSDEQMKALDWALIVAKYCGYACAFDLGTLQEQLKKLKG